MSSSAGTAIMLNVQAIVVTSSNTALTVTADPTATSIDLTAAYAGSTVTVTGTNFIAGFA